MHIKTSVRVRPLLSHEFDQKSTQIQIEPQSIKFYIHFILFTIFIRLQLENGLKTFSFDTVFDSSSTQKDVFNRLDVPSQVKNFFQGYSQTIFAYGQTGAGKTYTIEGTQQDQGLIPRIIEQIYMKCEMPDSDSIQNELTFSAYQIYNEKVFDMLFKGRPLKLKWDRNHEFGIENLTQRTCRRVSDMLKQFENAQKHRITSSHQLNEYSSRSHAIFTIQLEQTNLETNESIISKFHIVDLAGSERATQTKSQGQQLVECSEINKSLLSLRMVISALADGKKQHIPYRDSKLTSLLKQSLQGNSYIMMVNNRRECFNKQQFMIVGVHMPIGQVQLIKLLKSILWCKGIINKDRTKVYVKINRFDKNIEF